MDLLDRIKFSSAVFDNNPEINKLFKSGQLKFASDIARPAPKQNVIEIDALNAFMKRNPRADGGRINFNKAGVVTDRYSELMGMSLEELQKLGFPGNKKTTKVKSPSGKSYSKMTDELKNWIRSQTKKENPLRKKTVQPALDRVSDQILKAYANDDIRYIVTKDKFNKIGNFSKDDFRLLTQIKNNPDSLAIVSQNTGLNSDTILNLLEDRDAFIELERYEPIKKATEKKLYGDKQKFYKSAEKWIITNSKRYADPENFKKAFIRTFGKDNDLIKAINSNSATGRNVNFSNWFKQTILGGSPKTTYNSKLLNDIFKTAIYTNNKNVQNKILNEFKKILPEPGSKRTIDIRNAFRNNALLKKFGINNAIKGPIARLISNNIGKDMMKQISMFRDPFLGTADLLNFLSDRVDPRYKSMFIEAENAVRYAQNNQWSLAKKALENSESIMFDHKIPKEIINLGYADEIEYIKLNPTSAKFNTTIKRTQFDVPMIKLIKEFENANNLNAKANVVTKMNKLKNDFSKNHGGYLDEVSISVDKTGKPIFKSSAAPVDKKTDFISSLGKSKIQTGEIKPNSPLFKQLMKFCPKSSGATAGVCSVDEAMRGMISEAEQLKSGKMNKAQANQTAKKLRAISRVGTGSTLLKALGPYGIGGEVVLEGMFVANDMLGGGKTFKEAMSTSLLRYLMPKDKREALERSQDENKLILGSDTSGLAASYVDSLNKIKNMGDAYNKYQMMKKNEGFADVSGENIYSPNQIVKAEKDFFKAMKKTMPEYGIDAFRNIKYDSPAMRAFETKKEVFDHNRMLNKIAYDNKLLGPIKDLFDTGFYSDEQLKRLQKKADRETLDPLGRVQRSYEDKMQEVADYGGVANLAGGGIARIPLSDGTDINKEKINLDEIVKNIVGERKPHQLRESGVGSTAGIGIGNMMQKAPSAVGAIEGNKEKFIKSFLWAFENAEKEEKENIIKQWETKMGNVSINLTNMATGIETKGAEYLSNKIGLENALPTRIDENSVVEVIASLDLPKDFQAKMSAAQNLAGDDILDLTIKNNIFGISFNEEEGSGSTIEASGMLKFDEQGLKFKPAITKDDKNFITKSLNVAKTVGDEGVIGLNIAQGEENNLNKVGISFGSPINTKNLDFGNISLQTTTETSDNKDKTDSGITYTFPDGSTTIGATFERDNTKGEDVKKYEFEKYLDNSKLFAKRKEGDKGTNLNYGVKFTDGILDGLTIDKQNFLKYGKKFDLNKYNLEPIYDSKGKIIDYVENKSDMLKNRGMLEIGASLNNELEPNFNIMFTKKFDGNYNKKDKPYNYSYSGNELDEIYEEYQKTDGFTKEPIKPENRQVLYSQGGIVGLTKTIAPESGPKPQGLPYVYNNVKKI
jgi:hypothetical protein